MTLRGKILLLLGALLVTSLAGAGVTLWYGQRTLRLYSSTVDRDIKSLEAAQELVNSLVLQKAAMGYWFSSSEQGWLDKISARHENFTRALKTARRLSSAEKSRDILNRIESEYLRFVHGRDRAIEEYASGPGGAPGLGPALRDHFYNILDLCEQYKEEEKSDIALISRDYRNKARVLNMLAIGAIPVTAGLGLVLAWVLIGRILIPIRRLLEGAPEPGTGAGADEIKALKQRVQTLIRDVDKAHTDLEESREHLMQTEKLALAGKLAAGVAHSIRNPLTSVKMRLFSLERSLDLDDTQKDDFEVIAEEINHIDTIVRNFLEFSRRPKLKVRLISPSDVVDMTLQLLRHRLESYGVAVILERENRLPEVYVDPEQLKEVLVNLLLNSCEAMGEGGSITITEDEGVIEPKGRVVIVKISDNGPGIPEAIQEKIFEPFYSSKEEGSGLGLAIAKSIMEEHGGWIHIKSSPGQGATFVIAIPLGDRSNWLRS